MAGYVFLFFAAILQSVASNTGQGPAQGFIPDLVPDVKQRPFLGSQGGLRGAAAAHPGLFHRSPSDHRRQIWAGILLAIGILALAMALTMLVPERPIVEAPPLTGSLSGGWP